MAPEGFTLLDDGVAYVKDGGRALAPGGVEAMAPVPSGLEEAVVDSAAECPGECIFVEPDWLGQTAGYRWPLKRSRHRRPAKRRRRR